MAPETIAGASNKTCQELAKPGQTWLEIKADPNADGVYKSADETVVVTVSGTTDDKTFDWSSNVGLDAVFVKAGNAGSYLYRYDDPTSDTDPGETTSDTDLTTPGEGTSNAISHIAFCYDTSNTSPSPSPSTSITTSSTATTTATTTVSGTQTSTTTATGTTSVLGVRTRRGGGTLGRTGPENLGLLVAAGLAFVGLGFAFAALGAKPARR